MICSKCGGVLEVIETREKNNIVIRRRRCKACGKLFYTSETGMDYVEGMTITNEIRLRNKRKKKLEGGARRND